VFGGEKMIWSIAKKEFHQNILTARFIVGTLICIIFMAAVKITLLSEQKTLQDAYNRDVAENEENLKTYHTYSMIVADALRPPEPLAIYSEGLSKNLGNVITVRRQEAPHAASHSILDNPFLAVFSSIDVVLIFKLVLSLLALLFAFDMFSGEKENGTLRLMLSGGVSRAQVFFGKYLGGMLSLSLALFMSFIIGLLIILVAPFIKLSTEMLIRIALIYTVSVVFVASFFTLGALISALTHRSSTSLAFSLFVWVVLIVALPNLADYVASKISTVEPPRTIEAKVVALRNEIRPKIMQYFAQNQPRGGAINGSQNILEGTYRFSIAELGWMEFLDKFIPYSEKIRLEYADRVYAIWKEYTDKLVKQALRVDRFTLFSPVRLYENIAGILARTDASSHRKFMDQARQYREQILRYFQDKDVYHQYRFSTVMERGEPLDVRGNLFDEKS